MAKDLTEIPVLPALGAESLRIHRPKGTLVPTPASRIALQAIGDHHSRFRGRGLDWGSGSGLLAVAGARLASPVGGGFEMRRVVVRRAQDHLKPGGVLLLSVSAQYGEARVEGTGARRSGIPA